jgi:chemotaxis family two-component system sensor kinase Cph1
MQMPFPDLSQCADEPIRVPGAIQPHGWMLVMDLAKNLLAYSGNWADAGQAQSAVQALSHLMHDRLEHGQSPAPRGSCRIGDRDLDVLLHRSGEHIIAELEPAAPATHTKAPLYSLARHFLPQLHHAATLGSLAELAVAEMKRLTGFGRCLIYRFDAQGHGEVLAERADEGYDAYCGHRFPAADIPPQARELYRLNHLRLIPDARYQACALVGVRPGFDPRGVDLSYAGLRSVSPIHLEYMVNMGTLASMSVSILVGGRLWGLISCHDHHPRYLDYPVRASCEHLGQLLSLQIEAKEDNAEVATRLELRKLTLEIVAHLAESDATLQRLVTESSPLLHMAQAFGAAVVLDSRCWTTGQAPPAEAIHAMVDWIAASGAEVFHTDTLPQDFSQAEGADHAPAGVLAISISQVHRHFVLWFRPELVRTIQWAGDPHKQTRSADGRIHPRQSFASWREQLRGQSAPWTAGQVGAAGELRQALIGIVLRRAQEMAEAAVELGRVNKELEAFSYSVSHDLRAPMRHIAGYVDLVLDVDGAKLSSTANRYLGHVKEAAAFAGHLVDALLDFSRMGRAELKRSSVDTQAMVEGLRSEFIRQGRAGSVTWEIEDDLPVLHADPFLLQVAVRNVVDNAVKYTRSRAAPVVRVRGLRTVEGEGLEVSDNGVGFQMKYVGKLFGVFQRLHQAEEFEGTGIGLASFKRIIERHGGRVWAEGKVDEGAAFGFLLPRAPDEAQAKPTTTKTEIT